MPLFGESGSQVFDMFGDIVITYDDITAWVYAIAPAYASNQRSFDRYVRAWDVASKVRAAKLAGTFEAQIARAADRRSTLARRLGVIPA